MKLLMIDNYDSFTYNIVQYFGELGADVTVARNDEITVAEIDALLQAGQLDRLVISPGPCSPAEAGISVAAIQHFAGKLPILGDLPKKLGELETEDLLLILILYLMYRESGDRELLIIMGAMYLL